MTTWPTSNRDAMLDALVEVLKGIEGVKYVSRQAITTELVSDQQMPAIIIDEMRSQYRWQERHGLRAMGCVLGLALDLQTRSQLKSGGPNISTVRELFVARVLSELADKSSLTVQLAGEASAAPHAYDVAEQFDVRYPAAKAPYARALITLRASTQEILDYRTKTAWKELIATSYPYDDPPPTPGTIDLTF